MRTVLVGRPWTWTWRNTGTSGLGFKWALCFNCFNSSFIRSFHFFPIKFYWIPRKSWCACSLRNAVFQNMYLAQGVCYFLKLSCVYRKLLRERRAIEGEKNTEPCTVNSHTPVFCVFSGTCSFLSKFGFIFFWTKPLKKRRGSDMPLTGRKRVRTELWIPLDTFAEFLYISNMCTEATHTDSHPHRDVLDLWLQM